MTLILFCDVALTLLGLTLIVITVDKYHVTFLQFTSISYIHHSDFLFAIPEFPFVDGETTYWLN